MQQQQPPPAAVAVAAGRVRSNGQAVAAVGSASSAVAAVAAGTETMDEWGELQAQTDALQRARVTRQPPQATRQGAASARNTRKQERNAGADDQSASSSSGVAAGSKGAPSSSRRLSQSGLSAAAPSSSSSTSSSNEADMAHLLGGVTTSATGRPTRTVRTRRPAGTGTGAGSAAVAPVSVSGADSATLEDNGESGMLASRTRLSAEKEQAIPRRRARAALAADSLGPAAAASAVAAAAAAAASAAVAALSTPAAVQATHATTLSESLSAMVADLAPQPGGDDDNDTAGSPKRAKVSAAVKKLSEAAQGSHDIRGFFGASAKGAVALPPPPTLQSASSPAAPSFSAAAATTGSARKARGGKTATPPAATSGKKGKGAAAAATADSPTDVAPVRQSARKKRRTPIVIDLDEDEDGRTAATAANSAVPRAAAVAAAFVAQPRSSSVASVAFLQATATNSTRLVHPQPLPVATVAAAAASDAPTALPLVLSDSLSRAVSAVSAATPPPRPLSLSPPPTAAAANALTPRLPADALPFPPSSHALHADLSTGPQPPPAGGPVSGVVGGAGVAARSPVRTSARKRKAATSAPSEGQAPASANGGGEHSTPTKKRRGARAAIDSSAEADAVSEHSAAAATPPARTRRSATGSPATPFSPSPHLSHSSIGSRRASVSACCACVDGGAKCDTARCACVQTLRGCGPSCVPSCVNQRGHLFPVVAVDSALNDPSMMSDAVAPLHHTRSRSRSSTPSLGTPTRKKKEAGAAGSSSGKKGRGGAAGSASATKGCFCGLKKRSGQLVQCDACHRWCHFGCAGFKKDEDISALAWRCPPCEQRNAESTLTTIAQAQPLALTSVPPDGSSRRVLPSAAAPAAPAMSPPIAPAVASFPPAASSSSLPARSPPLPSPLSFAALVPSRPLPLFFSPEPADMEDENADADAVGARDYDTHMTAVTALASPVPLTTATLSSLPHPLPPAFARSFSEAPTPRLGADSYRSLDDDARQMMLGARASAAPMAAADATAVTDREVAAVTAVPAAAAAMRTMSTADTPFLSQGDASEAFAEGDESSHVAEDDDAVDREMSMDSPLLPPLATALCEGDEQEHEQDETSREADLLSRSLSRQSTLVGDSAFAPDASAAPTNRTIGCSTTVLLAPPLRSPDPSDTPSPAAAAAAAPVAMPQAIRRSNALAAPTSAVSSSPVKRGGGAAAAASSSAARRPQTGGAAGRGGGSGSGGRSAAPAVYRMEDLVDASVRVEPDGSALPLRARAAAATCCGGVKSINQDSFVCTALRTGSGASTSSGAANRPDALVLAVADGHGMLGHSASALVARELPLLLQSALLDGMDEVAALRQAVAAMHRHMNDDASALRLVVMRALMLPVPPVEPPQPIVLPPTRRSSRTGNGNGGEKANGLAAAGGAAGGTSSPTAVAKSPQPSAPVMGLMGADYGTTLVACVLRGKRISVAHVGDSRFMLFQRMAPSAVNAAAPAAAADASPSGPMRPKLTRDWQLMFCTEDHNAERASEAERVQREGGKLHHAEVYGGGGAGGNAAGPVVGGDVRVYPNCFTLEEARAKALTLNMSRSLGHIKLGLHGVSAEPDVTSFDLHAGVESCVVMGSDGLTDVLDAELIRNLVTPGSPEEVKQIARELLHVAEDRWERRAEATQRRLGDNITAVILRIFDVDGR